MIRRLDFKIVAIILITVLVPLGVSAVLVFRAIDTSLGLGLNEELAMQLRLAVNMHRTHIKDLKKSFQSCFLHLLDSNRLFNAATYGDEAEVRAVLKEVIDDNDRLKVIRLTFADDQSVLTISADNPFEAADAKTVILSEELVFGPFARIETVFEAEGSLARNLKSAGEILDTYEALVSAPPNYLKNRFIIVYLGILSVAVILSVFVGIFLARRIIRRIHHLASATGKVAAGDLTVRLDSGSRDEVGQLVLAFNTMVSELSSSRARIEYLQKISAWQEIARRLAHEIKNPLTPIQLAAQQLKEKYDGGDARFGSLLDQSVEIIKEEVETLRRLTSDFAAFAKLPKVNPERIDPAEFLREFESSISKVVEQLGVRISFRIKTAGLHVSVDRIMMKRVMDNLIRNAAEALLHFDVSDPSILVTANVRKISKKNELEIRISDNGPGVSVEHRPTIFDPYFTTKSEGTGLGLAISKKIVLEHGGRIWLDEKCEKGATFIMCLPALK